MQHLLLRIHRAVASQGSDANRRSSILLPCPTDNKKLTRVTDVRNMQKEALGQIPETGAVRNQSWA